VSVKTEMFTQLDGVAGDGSLSRRLIRVADRMRDLRVRFGFRPYVVHMVRTRWPSGLRGKGPEVLVSDDVLLPVPLISDLTGLALTADAAIFKEMGSIVLSEVSGTYTENMLRGLGGDGNSIPEDESFWYEVEFKAGTESAERRRFSIRSAPTYQASRFQWLITLYAAAQGRGRDGELR